MFYNYGCRNDIIQFSGNSNWKTAKSSPAFLVLNNLSNPKRYYSFYSISQGLLSKQIIDSNYLRLTGVRYGFIVSSGVRKSILR